MYSSTIFPTSFSEVSAAVRGANGAVNVRSGGYSTFTKNPNALTIDLSKLNTVHIDAENQRAYVQGGCRFAQVEQEAIKHGLAIPAGTVSDIGVGGLTTGGGFGWLSGEHGLTIDSLLETTVVTANGEILKANAGENADLFWGVRGGGSNFGIIVEFVFRLYPQRSEVYTTSLTYPSTLLPIVVQQVNRWTRKQSANEAGRLSFSVDNDGKPVISWFGFKNSDAQAGASAFKGFVELGPIRNESGMVPYEKLNTMLDGFNASVHNRLHAGIPLDGLHLKTFKKAFEGFCELLTQDAPKSYVGFEFYHPSKVASVPVEATAFAQRAPVYNVLITTQWEKATFEAVARVATAELAERIARASSTGSEESAVGYPNYADVVAGDNATDKHARLAFGVNYERMQEVKKRYDPAGVFNGWFAVQPAL